VKEYYYEFSIEYDGTSFVVGIVDNRTGEWEANTGNDLLNEYINNDSARFDAYDLLVQEAMLSEREHEKEVIREWRNKPQSLKMKARVYEEGARMDDLIPESPPFRIKQNRKGDL